MPLYLAWAGLAEEPAAAAAARFWSSGEHGAGLPAWVDLANGAVSPEAAGPGIAAIAQFVLAARAGGGPVEMPTVAAAPDYYAAALTLLARLAWEDSRPTWAAA